MPDTQRTSWAHAQWYVDNHVPDERDFCVVCIRRYPCDPVTFATDYLAALDVVAWYADPANRHEDDAVAYGYRARAFLASTEGGNP